MRICPSLSDPVRVYMHMFFVVQTIYGCQRCLALTRHGHVVMWTYTVTLY